MPEQKELDFFSNDSLFYKGLDWYRNKWFVSADPGKKWGDASPQYMIYDYVPSRIYGCLPDVKLIAILRNPIDRAYSHYRMAVRRNLENRPFENAICQLISRGFVPDNNRYGNLNYVLFGEYGRILRHYLDFFRKEQIKVVFLDDLAYEAEMTIRDILKFLEIGRYYTTPHDLNKRYHEGGMKRFPNIENFVLRKRWLKNLIKQLIPSSMLSKFLFWFETEFNVKKQNLQQGPPYTARQILRDYYREDISLLEKTLDIKLPWKEFK